MTLMCLATEPEKRLIRQRTTAVCSRRYDTATYQRRSAPRHAAAAVDQLVEQSSHRSANGRVNGMLLIKAAERVIAY